MVIAVHCMLVVSGRVLFAVSHGSWKKHFVQLSVFLYFSWATGFYCIICSPSNATSLICRSCAFLKVLDFTWNAILEEMRSMRVPMECLFGNFISEQEAIKCPRGLWYLGSWCCQPLSSRSARRQVQRCISFLRAQIRPSDWSAAALLMALSGPVVRPDKWPVCDEWTLLFSPGAAAGFDLFVLLFNPGSSGSGVTGTALWQGFPGDTMQMLSHPCGSWLRQPEARCILKCTHCWDCTVCNTVLLPLRTQPAFPFCMSPGNLCKTR